MILAIDIGTTSAKAALFHSDGRCIALERRSIQSYLGNSPLEQEIDPGEWSRALEELLARLSQGRVDGLKNLQCIAISGNGPTLFPVDANGNALHKALTWMDRRAYKESQELLATTWQKTGSGHTTCPRRFGLKKTGKRYIKKPDTSCLVPSISVHCSPIGG